MFSVLTSAQVLPAYMPCLVPAGRAGNSSPLSQTRKLPKRANGNVVRNQLGHLIRVIQVSEESTTLIKDLTRQFMDLQFTFCMCNPPFFESCETSKRFSLDEASGAMINECPVDLEDRTPPRSATLAQRGELEVDGGEVAFIGRLIDESVLLQTQVSIYTTMLGKKSSISVLCRRLSRIDGVRYTVSTLSQGRTLRWVLAWTFLPQIHLENKSYSALFLPFPDNMTTSPLQWIRSHLEHLGIEMERENLDMLICSARNVTWTNQRAKRRSDAKLKTPDMKKMSMLWQRNDNISLKLFGPLLERHRGSTWSYRIRIKANPHKTSKQDSCFQLLMFGIQVSMGVGDGRDSLSNAGNFESCITAPNSCGRSDVITQAYFPCSVRPSMLRFRVIHFRENCGISLEYIDGYKPGLYQLLQLFMVQTTIFPSAEIFSRVDQSFEAVIVMHWKLHGIKIWECKELTDVQNFRLIGTHVHLPSASVSNCWSPWSPCTVTCTSQQSGDKDLDFAWRWRVWLPKKCPFVDPPNHRTQFKRCSASVPPCLLLENIFQPSSRTVYRLTALVLLMLISVVPSLLICCKYSSGVPIIHWGQEEHDSLGNAMLDSILLSEVTEDLNERHQKRQNADSISGQSSTGELCS
ncbi:hypothetical protein KIN20_004224 [Parelaphostrongylus tenuis]|uniref:Uncharacterized protein n=1 Tax=Parelaphostrongylus tenuis TaxID=148309 RepID=A0AAD5MJL7_PARTN|nr:hypothetical protein KIN20_004224 [Parelaphostrongylus tenuis]